jgi:hypothetical protein
MIEALEVLGYAVLVVCASFGTWHGVYALVDLALNKFEGNDK